MDGIESNTNFGRFMKASVFIFKLMGIEFTQQPRLRTKVLQSIVLISLFLMTVHEVIYLLTTEDSFADRALVFSYISYCFVAFGRVISMMYYRISMVELLDRLRNIHPSVEVQRKQKLDQYLRKYLQLQYMYLVAIILIIIFYQTYPIIQSFSSLWFFGEYTYKSPLIQWYPVPPEESLLVYILYYLLQCMSTGVSGLSATSFDLCLFSLVSMLCMQFDLITEKVMALEPQLADSVNKLKDIIAEHQNILRLAEDFNIIFTIPILMCLLSSTLNLCFIVYQVLDDVPLVLILRAGLLMCYELKQVAIICFYGNKLISSSSRIFDAVYMHNWHNGSMEYKRLVLFMLIATHRPVSLHFVVVNDISMITLKEVLSLSYQIYAVFKKN